MRFETDIGGLSYSSRMQIICEFGNASALEVVEVEFETALFLKQFFE